MEPCIEWTRSKNEKGYGQTFYRGKMVKAHRLAYCEANGVSLESIDGQVIRHSCDNPSCVNPKHLSIGTVADNNQDQVDRNRRPKGASHGLVKLTAADIPNIRRQLALGLSMSKIARDFGVGRSTIVAIRDGKTWKDV